MMNNKRQLSLTIKIVLNIKLTIIYYNNMFFINNMLTQIREIDILILSYIDDDYLLYKICKLNNYLMSLYNDNSLWMLKINNICMDLHMDLHILEQINDKLYFDIKKFINVDYDKDNKHYYDNLSNNTENFLNYAIKNNLVSVLDWIIKYKGSCLEYNPTDIMISIACEHGNITIIDYVIEKFGVPEIEILDKYKNWSVEYKIEYLHKNNKCIQFNWDIKFTNIEILEYFEEFGVCVDLLTNTTSKIYPDRESIEHYLEENKYDIVYWCETRGLL